MATEAHPQPTPFRADPAPSRSPAGADSRPHDAADAGADGAALKRSYGTLVVVLFVGYMAVAIGLYVWRGAYFTPDRWAVLLFVGALVLGRWKAFLRDWVPVVMLIFGYEFMRGIAAKLVQDQMESSGRDVVHVQELIDADRALFGGTLPTHWLQDRFYVEGQVHWYDYVALLFYALHFVFPLVFAFILWLGRKERFWQFSLTFLLMTYAAFAFFLFYPAGPPWLAQRWGFVSDIAWPASQAYQAMAPDPIANFDTYQIWNKASGNAVAAMPSLHAGFPWLVLLYAVKYFGRRGLLFLPYSPILWFSVVYLGHHWVIDLLAGIAWATVCFVVMQFAWPWLARGINIPVPAPIRRLTAVRPTLAWFRARS